MTALDPKILGDVDRFVGTKAKMKIGKDYIVKVNKDKKTPNTGYGLFKYYVPSGGSRDTYYMEVPAVRIICSKGKVGIVDVYRGVNWKLIDLKNKAMNIKELQDVHKKEIKSLQKKQKVAIPLFQNASVMEIKNNIYAERYLMFNGDHFVVSESKEKDFNSILKNINKNAPNPIRSKNKIKNSFVVILHDRYYSYVQTPTLTTDKLI